MNAPKKLALTLSALVIALPQAGSARPAALSRSWAGTWQLNTDKSKFSSAEFARKSDTRIYTVAGNRLTMQSTMITAAGATIKWSYSAKTDGKWYPTSGNPNMDQIALTFVSPRALKWTSRLKGKPSVRSTATVSADGKELTIGRSMLTAKGGPTNDILVFDRAK